MADEGSFFKLTELLTEDERYNLHQLLRMSASGKQRQLRNLPPEV